MLKIIIPCAGSASRFFDAGYTDYKPMLPVVDGFMLDRVMDNLTPDEEHEFIIVYRKEYQKEFRNYLRERDNVRLIEIDEPTSGAAHTILRGLTWTESTDEIIIANCDQYILDFGVDDFLENCRERKANGIVLFEPNDGSSKYSFAELNNDGVCETQEIVRVAEKQRISGFATVGIYYIKSSETAVQAIANMVTAGDRFNGEYYFCPSFNYIPRSQVIMPYWVQQEEMLGLGTPEDYEKNKYLIPKRNDN